MKRQATSATCAGEKPGWPLTEPVEVAGMLRLIEAAEIIFLEKGYHTATMNEVAKAAGMSKKTIYKLIDSKVGLLVALLEYRIEKLKMPVFKENCTIDEALVQVLIRIGQYILAPEQIAMTRLIIAEYTHSGDFSRIFHRHRMKKAKTMLDQVLSEIGPPDYRKVAQLGEMSAMLFGMALGEFYTTALVGFRPVPTKATMTRRIRCAVDLFLNECKKK